jgi:hypothetical protein
MQVSEIFSTGGGCCGGDYGHDHESHYSSGGYEHKDDHGGYYKSSYGHGGYGHGGHGGGLLSIKVRVL